ncbi:hypothetical protein EMIT0P100_20566 [Pseudomonas sp. IT-P100]|jgi:hypothetical protein
MVSDVRRLSRQRKAQQGIKVPKKHDSEFAYKVCGRHLILRHLKLNEAQHGERFYKSLEFLRRCSRRMKAESSLSSLLANWQMICRFLSDN